MRFIKIEHYMNDDELSLNLYEKEIDNYNKYFDNVIKTSLTKKFIFSYLKFSGFHDWIFQSVQNIFDGKKHTTMNME